MLRILEIKNFKAIKSGVFPLANLCLLTGVNGMGKSSILQSLLLLRQSYQERMLDLSPSLLMLNGPLVNIGKARDAYAQFGDDGCIEFGISSKSEGSARWSFLAASQEPGLNDSDVLSIVAEKSHVPPEIFNTSLFINRFQYIPAERIAVMTAYPASTYAVRGLRQIGSQACYAIHFLHTYREQPLAIPHLKHSSTAEADLSILSNVRAWLGEISPGIRLNTYLDSDLDQVRLTYQYDAGPEHGMTNEFRPVNVGFGINYILPVIVAILTAREGDLILIENPESHLHPRGQSRIGRLCALAAANGVQLLIETQSDHMLNGVRLAVKQELINPDEVSIFFLDRERENSDHATNITQPKMDRNGKMENWPEGFFDEWDNITFQLI